MSSFLALIRIQVNTPSAPTALPPHTHSHTFTANFGVALCPLCVRGLMGTHFISFPSQLSISQNPEQAVRGSQRWMFKTQRFCLPFFPFHSIQSRSQISAGLFSLLWCFSSFKIHFCKSNSLFFSYSYTLALTFGCESQSAVIEIPPLEMGRTFKNTSQKWSFF